MVRLLCFPSSAIEIIKPFFVLITASLICSGKEKRLNILTFELNPILSIIFLLLNQPDVGQSILLITTWISIIFISGIKISYIFFLFCFIFVLLFALLIILPEKIWLYSE